MKCLAARTGELVNSDAIARDVGVSVKTPKVYFMDTGLVCYLVGWSSPQVAMNGAMSGALFENFVISEIIKSYYNSGHDAQNLYFYRDKDQKEIDLIIEKDGVLYPVEIKKSSRPTNNYIWTFALIVLSNPCSRKSKK